MSTMQEKRDGFKPGVKVKIIAERAGRHRYMRIGDVVEILNGDITESGVEPWIRVVHPDHVPQNREMNYDDHQWNYHLSDLEFAEDVKKSTAASVPTAIVKHFASPTRSITARDCLIALEDLAERGLFDAADEKAAQEVVEKFVTDNPQRWCGPGIERIRDAAGLNPKDEWVPWHEALTDERIIVWPHINTRSKATKVNRTSSGMLRLWNEHDTLQYTVPDHGENAGKVRVLAK